METIVEDVSRCVIVALSQFATFLSQQILKRFNSFEIGLQRSNELVNGLLKQLRVFRAKLGWGFLHVSIPEAYYVVVDTGRHYKTFGRSAMQGRIRKHDRVGLFSTQFFGVLDDGGDMLPRGGRKQLNPSLTDSCEGETSLKTYWGMG